MGRIFQGRRENRQAAVRTIRGGPVVIIGVVLTCVAILLAAGLRRYSKEFEEPKTIPFPATNDIDGYPIEHTVIEAAKESLSSSSEGGKEILTASLNEKHIAGIIAEIHNSDSSKKVQMVRDLWLIAADRGMPDDALQTLEYLVLNDTNPAVVGMAAQAEKDLRHLINMANQHLWLAESNTSIEQDAIQDRRDSGEAILDPGDLDASELEDLQSDAYSDSAQSSHESEFDRKQELAELIAAAEASDPARKVELIHEMWILAADIGVPDSVLESLEYMATYDPDDAVAEAARHAKKDLENLCDVYSHDIDALHYKLDEEEHDHKQDHIMDRQHISDRTIQGESVQNDLVLRYPASDQDEQTSDIRVDELAEQALRDPYEENRYSAIQQLSSIRSEAAVDILLQAASDPAVSNRLKAIECLWLSAADGMDRYGDIRANIQWAVEDPDDRVSDIAGKALSDLERLMESVR
jgi:hypothetical protein